jgi:hypothetical protein
MALVIPMAGANVARRTTTKEFTLGTAQIDDQNRTWVYVVSNVVVNAAQAPVVSGAFALTAATGGAYTADVAFTIGEYGWVRKTASPL